MPDDLPTTTDATTTEAAAGGETETPEVALEEGVALAEDGAEGEGEEAPPPAPEKKDFKQLSSLAKQKKAIREKTAEVRSQAQHNAQERARLEQASAAQREFAEATRDPEKFLEYAARHGVRLEDKIGEYIASQDPARRQELDARKRESEMERQIRELREANEKAQSSQLQQATATAVRAFLGMMGDESRFEAANAIYSDNEKVAKADLIALDAQRRGIPFTADMLADAVEELAKDDARFKRIQTRYVKTPATPPAIKQAPPATRAAKPTLSSKDAGERARDGVPNFEDLPFEERIARASLKVPAGR